MDVILIEDAPAQEFLLRLDDGQFKLRFSYNQIYDRWSLSCWPSDQKCPVFAGRFVTTGVNLIRGASDKKAMVAVDHPGIGVSGMNWYDRMVKPINGLSAATFIAFGLKSEFQEIANDTAIQQICRN